MDTFSITRTSANSADCDPIILRETDQRRLIFKPVLLDNPHDSEACVDGTFVFQRKRKAASWEDHNVVKLSQLRADEWVKLKLSAEEVHSFLREAAALYRHHKKHGLPKTKVHLLKVDLADDDADEISRLDFDRIVELSRKAGVDVVSQFFGWIASVENSRAAVSRLQRLDSASLERLDVLTRLGVLKSVLSEWEDQLESADEEYWQKSIQQHAFVLSQLVSGPILVMHGKAYVGGKSVDNTGGHVADYLVKNAVTENAMIVELKTPQTQLLDRNEYRNGVYAPTRDLAGAVSQALTYRHSLMEEYAALAANSSATFRAFRPKALVVAGQARELDSDSRLRCFELFRAELKDVSIVTYDELVEKLRQLIHALESGKQPAD